ncbi:hypothetical protein Q0M94_07835 [Deinococcus radiomollis]|uniref:hypothetical protein n=1 Tax=Deinococcus radiomollis TaxID=468916 RepID=UPI0038925F2F
MNGAFSLFLPIEATRLELVSSIITEPDSSDQRRDIRPINLSIVPSWTEATWVNAPYGFQPNRYIFEIQLLFFILSAEMNRTAFFI